MSDEPLAVAVIVGSTRPNRHSESVARWGGEWSWSDWTLTPSHVHLVRRRGCERIVSPS